MAGNTPDQALADLRVGWVVRVYPEAGEAGGTWCSADPGGGPPRDDDGDDGGGGGDRAAEEAARRARAKIRRYCCANRLNRLGTLTYRGSGNHDPRLLRRHLGVFFRRLRGEVGGGAFPYVWVPEWHKTGHGLHAHFAVGRFIARRKIEAAWDHGFVHIKLIGDLPVGSGAREESRKAAGYLAKYAGKAFDERRVPGLHRYEVAQGFAPVSQVVAARTRDQVLAEASRLMGGAPTVVWCSSEAADWQGPPAVWASWA